jgi:hypothetical protein
VILALLLLAAAAQVEIVEQSTEVPPADWKARRFSMRKPGVVEVTYRVTKGGAGVRLALIARRDEARVELRREHTEFAATGFAREGTLHARLDEPGEYSVLVDNRLETQRAATVSFKGLISYDAPRPQVRTLSTGRKIAVIGSSLTLFFGICLFAGRRLWTAISVRGI